MLVHPGGELATTANDSRGAVGHRPHRSLIKQDTQHAEKAPPVQNNIHLGLLGSRLQLGLHGGGHVLHDRLDGRRRTRGVGVRHGGGCV